jgi:hypothetical protein
MNTSPIVKITNPPPAVRSNRREKHRPPKGTPSIARVSKIGDLLQKERGPLITFHTHTFALSKENNRSKDLLSIMKKLRSFNVAPK